MKERKKREHAMVRKLFMLMAAFVLILCMKTTTYAASTKTVNMESVGSGMYIHIGTMKRGKGTVYHRVKVKRHPDRCRGSNRRRRNAVWYGSSPV